MRSPSEILEAERPRLIQTRFGSALLRGELKSFARLAEREAREPRAAAQPR
jgi:hypothetical protein